MEHITLQNDRQQQQHPAQGGVPKAPKRHEPDFSPNTSMLLMEEDECTDLGVDHETQMRVCFAATFDREVDYLNSQGTPVTKERKRQILADILVWAEIEQSHYDKSVKRFVLEPNQQDSSFMRVGLFLQESKKQHGIR